MNFQEAEAYLLSLGNEVEAMKLGLESIRRLLAALGDPQNNYLKVQVAGTNGKGSVCAFLDSICVRAGIKTGLYTSPHLISITERIKVAGEEITEDDFARHATAVRAAAEELFAVAGLNSIPTFFEQVTAIALNYFAEQKVELAILETGLGGRLDATTAANAEIVAITQIDLDHQEYLGVTMEEIAAEKAAVIRRDTKVVIGDQSSGPLKILDDVCTDFGVIPKMAQHVRTTCGSGWLKFETSKAFYEMEKLSLPGRHQIENAKTAILLAEELQVHFQISREDIVAGLQDARHPGRLELVDGILLDGAHNRAGARALREFLDESIDRPVVMIFGAMRDKDVHTIADILFEKADTLILTKSANQRASTADEIAEMLPERILSGKVILTETAAEALDSAGKIAGDEKLIVVTGSLYLVGEVKRIINKMLDTV